MKRCFNNVQMFKSSENCDKYSKSVSYETLVGETTTIGMGIKQTRRLFLSSANKPLSAVGTLKSLLCNSAKVKAQSFLRLRGASGAQGISTPASCREAHKRRFLFNLIRRSFEKFFKKNFRDDSFTFGFAKILALTIFFTIATTAESWAACDNGYELHNGRCIKKCGYKYSGCKECYYDNDGNPTECKAYTCGYKYGPCSECSYNEDGSGPIACTKCTSGYKAKNGTCFWGAPGASCGDGYVDGDGVCYKIPDGCESASATDGSCTKCSAGLSFDDDNNCIECNKKGYKNVGGYCNRVQWTPAEAAQVLTDDNNNSVTITFKK